MTDIERLNDLIDEHEENYLDCPGCEMCNEIDLLQSSLDRDVNVKFRHILAKGPDMTTNELKMIVENGVSRGLIRESLEMSATAYSKLRKSLNVSPEDIEAAEKEDKMFVNELKEKRILTREEYLILKEKRISDKEICKNQGFSSFILNRLKKEWKIPKQEKNKTKFVEKERYLELKSQGYNDQQIAELINMVPKTLWLFKKEWGLAKERRVRNG